MGRWRVEEKDWLSRHSQSKTEWHCLPSCVAEPRELPKTLDETHECIEGNRENDGDLALRKL